MESAYEYGSRVGFWRLMRVFAERQVIPTIYAVGMALERNPQAAETMARQGCDVVDHGWRWLDYHGIETTSDTLRFSRYASGSCGLSLAPWPRASMRMSR